MKNSVKIASVLALAAGLGLASSAMAATVPYLYVYSVVGGTPGGQAQAVLASVTAGPNSQVGLPQGGLPQTLGTSDTAPLIVQNGLATGALSANLTYNITIPVNGGS